MSQETKSTMVSQSAHNEFIQQSDGHRNTIGQLPYAEHGALVDHVVPQNDLVQAQPDLLWNKIRRQFREALSEFFGTFILVLFGNGVNAQVVLSGGTKGDWQSICWGWGIGVMLGVYTGGISGAHLNPAVTLSNCLYRKFPWRKFPIYLVAQTIGALCASAVVYANYKSAIDVFEGGPHIRTVPGYSDTATAGIFSTYPAKYLTTTGQFFDELIGSAVLMFMIYALKDEGNIGAGNLTPLGLFFVVFGIGTSFGSQTNFAINSARDFGPRLMTYMLGYGPQVWTSGNYYFWVPVVAPLLGCALGGWLYDMFLFTGDSPINTEFAGLARLVRWNTATWSNKNNSQV
ncbi:aquaglyceroporin like protein [Hyaloscypha variabilis]